MTASSSEKSSPEQHKSSTTSSSESSSDSTSSTSPPSTPPSPDQEQPPEYVQQDDQYLQALPRIHHASHSSNPPRRGNRRGRPRTSPPSRLGAIDEHSNSVAPDVPTRNPNRKTPGFNNKYKFFNFGAYLRFDKEDVPPVNAYDKIVGPHGEKFGDLRSNKPFAPPGRGGLKRLVCLGLVIFIVVAVALGVGLGIGLTKKKGTSVDVSPIGNPSPSDENHTLPFPLGTYTIPTFLTTISANCTTNPATWRCYPYTTYSPSTATTAYSPLVWRITSPNNSTLNLEISSTQTAFSYPFQNVPIELSNGNDNRLSAFTFTYNYRKLVVPNADITGTGAATRCYYNDTMLSVRLYSTSQGTGGNITPPPNSTMMSRGAIEDWPYAIEYTETINEGPECFKYVNGLETDRVDVAAGTGSCACSYRNYGLS